MKIKIMLNLNVFFKKNKYKIILFIFSFIIFLTISEIFLMLFYPAPYIKLISITSDNATFKLVKNPALIYIPKKNYLLEDNHIKLKESLNFNRFGYKGIPGNKKNIIYFF